MPAKRSNSTTPKRESIAVIGGGAAGCETALLLSQLRGADEWPLYDVHLIEAQDVLLNGATLIAARWHLGGEYPLHAPTGIDCLHGAVIGNLILPMHKNHFFTDIKPMKFFVAEETQRSGALTHEAFWKYYNGTIRAEYERLFKVITRSKEWSTRITGNILFGSPEEGEFCRQLTQGDLKDYPGVAGGFQSNERGLDIVRFLSAIDSAVGWEQERGRIDLRLGRRVANGPPEILKDGRKRIHFETADQPPLDVDQVVVAVGDRTAEVLPFAEGQSVTVYTRAMLYTPKVNLGNHLDPFFVMVGEHGIMYAPVNEKTLLSSQPVKGSTYRGGERLLTRDNPSLPDEWPVTPDELRRKPPTHEELVARARIIQEWSQTSYELAANKLPWLDGAVAPYTGKAAGFMRFTLPIRNTLNFQHKLEQRRHEPPHEESPGVWRLNLTKRTYSAYGALQTVLGIRERSQRGMFDRELVNTPGFVPTLQAAMSPEYSLRNIIEPDPVARYFFITSHPDIPHSASAREKSEEELEKLGYDKRRMARSMALLQRRFGTSKSEPKPPSRPRQIGPRPQALVNNDNDLTS